MSATTANLRGSILKRLAIEQMGSNLSEGTLTTPLLEDAGKYNVQIENFFVLSDVPIYPANTIVCGIMPRGDEGTAYPLELVTGSRHLVVVGPCYSWLDFCSQIQTSLGKFSSEQNHGVVGVDGRFMTQKKLAFRGDLDFWQENVIEFVDPFGSIFGIKPLFLQNNNFYIISYLTILEQLDNHPILTVTLGNLVYNLAQILAFPAGQTTHIHAVETRMELFENRHRIRIDCVLPLPHELYGVGMKNESTRMSNRYTFMEFDWPNEQMHCVTHTQGTQFEEKYGIEQRVLTGSMQIIKPGLHSGLKKMLVGQTQTHRYQLFIIRKEVQTDGTVKLIERPWPMSEGDYFYLSLLFVKDV